ncbi:MAG: hypothetical protein ACHQDE_02205, partial [Acidimicrobiia bacterium]
MTTSPSAAVQAFLAAVREPGAETHSAARAQVTAAVRVFGPFGQGSGGAAFDAMLEHPLVARLLTGAEWSEPELDGDVVRVTATAKPGAGVGGFRFGLHLDEQDQIDRIEQDLLPAPPLERQPI